MGRFDGEFPLFFPLTIRLFIRSWSSKAGSQKGLATQKGSTWSPSTDLHEFNESGKGELHRSFLRIQLQLQFIETEYRDEGMKFITSSSLWVDQQSGRA